MFCSNRELKGNTTNSPLLPIGNRSRRSTGSLTWHTIIPEALAPGRRPISNFHIRDVIYTTWHKDAKGAQEARVCCGPCNPSKWEADIWGWLDVRMSAMLHFNKRQHPHWACRVYGHTGGTRRWLGVERLQLCLRDTSRSAKCHRRAVVGHWVSVCECEVL